jgi:hypothetical protein
MPAKERVSMLPRGGASVAMAVALTALVSAVGYSHYQQVRDKAVMKAGVERDRERLRMLRDKRKRERQQQRQEQQSS